MKLFIVVALAVLIAAAAQGVVEKTPPISASRRKSLRESRKRRIPQRFVMESPTFSNTSCPESAYAGVKTALEEIANASGQDRWAARFLRLGFHDCLPSSCDGSIRFELERVPNAGLDVALAAVETAIEGTCVGVADAIKIATVLSMELSGGPSVICPMGNIEDATEANPDDRLPGPNDAFEDIVADFESMGFTLVEMLAGNYGGHSLGQFRTFADDGVTIINNEFTPNPAIFSGSAFAQFIVDGALASQVGFNALRSDRTLFSDTTAAPIVQQFATDMSYLQSTFRQFLSKMCSV